MRDDEFDEEWQAAYAMTMKEAKSLANILAHGLEQLQPSGSKKLPGIHRDNGDPLPFEINVRRDESGAFHASVSVHTVMFPRGEAGLLENYGPAEAIGEAFEMLARYMIKTARWAAVLGKAFRTLGKKEN
jgi:hypothetical protein